MQNAKYSVLTIAILVCNIVVIISGIFFAPQLAWEIPKRCILMGIVTVASIIPVSYTHLDVYKRQVLTCRPNTRDI